MSRNKISQTYALSKNGLNDLRNKLQNLRSQRADKIEVLQDQRSSSSYEDSAYIQTLAELQLLSAKIDDTESILYRAKVIDRDPYPNEVKLGNYVTLEVDDGRHLEYMIVSSVEADPSEGKISDRSPLGKQLVGKRLKDIIIHAPKRRGRTLSLKLIGIK